MRIAYDQVLDRVGRPGRYVYPLSVGAERATQIDDFTVHVRATDTRAKLDEVETPRYATSKNGDDTRISASASEPSSSRPRTTSWCLTRGKRRRRAEVSAYVPSWGEFKGAGWMAQHEAPKAVATSRCA